MPFVRISLARGKPAEHLEAVSRAVHDALVAELNIDPDDQFQLIEQHDPSELRFDRNFRGGPRSDDWIVFTITDGIDHGQSVKRRFYKTLAGLLEEGPGVRPADVFVMMTVTPTENFSFADGVIGTDVVAAEALDAAAKISGTRNAYTKTEMATAITTLLTHRDRGPILPMLRDDVVLKVPTTLPYGGEFTGITAFDGFFAGFAGNQVWRSFVVHLDDIIESDKHFIVQLTNTGVLEASGKTVVFQNLWLFEAADGKFIRVQLYADTAAAQTTSA